MNWRVRGNSTTNVVGVADVVVILLAIVAGWAVIYYACCHAKPADTQSVDPRIVRLQDMLDAINRLNEERGKT
jgi:hypothetical protein